ncbi:ATP-grasp fold amidoligase family protein [Halorussus salinisoli]|uniref:ATP-grasp fold amidoligase family protein n=1 Tax=Halorussus salinisoli TaxID=2558242 RepID=UPI0010C23FDF|nr:ATP-grasp fold amidoligase family protein [Halorussus salinisoli]
MNIANLLSQVYSAPRLSPETKHDAISRVSNSPLSPIIKWVFGKPLPQKLLMYKKVGYWPQLRNPRSFNEKVMYRKLFTDNETFSNLEDKWRVREYVEKKVGDQVLKEVYHVTDDPDTIPFETLPEEFVVKPTHSSGPIIIIDDKKDADWESIQAQCNDWLSEKHGVLKQEYWYWQINPKIIVEERLHDDEYGVPLDFKFFVFNGRVKFIQVDVDRFSGHTRRFFDREWDPQEFTLEFPLGPKIEKPNKLSEMISVAETLGEDFDFMRVDLYQPNEEEVIFGELTIAPGSGRERFSPVEYDFKLGSFWQ